MSKGNTTENDVVALIFNKVLAAIWGTLATTGDANVYVALYSADPGEAGAPNNNETVYTDYARQAVARTVGGWTVAGNQATNAADITFPVCGAAGDTITHVGVVTSASGASGQILYSGALTAPLVVSTGIAPEFFAGDLTIEED